MWDVSDDFLEAIRGTHRVIARADVFFSGILVASDLAVEAGSVTVDEGSQVRRSATITVSDPDLDPAGIIDLLSPFGTEVMLRRGVEFGNGDQELIPLGVFRIDEARRSSWLAGVELQCSDRSAAIADARFVVPWNTSAGTLITDEIYAMLVDAMPGVEFYDITNSTATTTAGSWERDRWDAIEKLAASIGAEVVFDNLGRAVCRPVATSLNSIPAWTVAAGDTGVLIDVATGISRAEVFNAVVATGEPQDTTIPPVIGYAFVGSGPLYWGGPFGKKPRFFSSTFITTVDQASQAAQAILARSSGFYRTVEPTAIVNPALDVGDTLAVALPDGRVYTQLVRSFTVPLEASGSMQIGTRVVSENPITLDGTLA